ncbi:MAG: YabP/YqfC family sporulation protein [Clostridia bacterium]|nr:YabP/YqfC family sporulation protein [Clostridia bacterium]
MRQKKDWMRRIRQRLDIPCEALPGGFSLYLSGQNELTVKGCRRILSYGRERICLALGKTVLCVMGSDLLCTAFCAGSVTVEGTVTGLYLGEEAHRAD